MDWNLLRTFAAYVESASIVAAARQLGLSQPGVTAQLQRLERELPLPPYVTHGRRKTLTVYGQALYDAVAPELARVERALEAVNARFLDPHAVTVRIGARREIVPRVAPLFRTDARLVFSAHAGGELERLLKERKLDIVVTQQDLAGPQWAARTLFTERARLVVARELLAARGIAEKALTPKGLAGVPCLAYKEDPPFLKEWMAASKLPVGDLDIRVVCDDWTALAAMVEAGRGFSIIPGSIAVDSERCAVQDIAASVVPPLAFRAIYHRDLLEIPALRALIRALPR